MASLSFLCCGILLFASVFLNPVGCHAQFNLGNATHKALFVFGDSLFDPGNILYLNKSIEQIVDKWPYGETYFKSPTGRISDGRTVPDFIAQFANLPLPSAYLKPGAKELTDGTNFAVAGARALEISSGSINLKGQLNYLKEVETSLKQKLGDEGAKKVLRDAVYLFSIGGVDYLAINPTNPPKDDYVISVVGNLTSVLTEIYNMGGRKFAFQNVGILGCLPLMKTLDPTLGSACKESLSTLPRLHNRYLADALEKLSTQLPGFKYSIYDYYNAIADRVANPSKYGFIEGKAACCGSGTYRGLNCGVRVNGTQAFEVCSDPKEYLWFDGGHNTEFANDQLALLLWNGAPPVTGPYNVEQLFSL